MTARKPYVLRRYDHGAYTVHDRATGEKVGRALHTADEWEVFVGTDGPRMGWTRSLSDAAERLWETRP